MVMVSWSGLDVISELIVHLGSFQAIRHWCFVHSFVIG